MAFGTVIRDYAIPAVVDGLSNKRIGWDGRHIWIANHKSDDVVVISPRTGLVVRVLEVAQDNFVVTWDTSRLWGVDGAIWTPYALQNGARIGGFPAFNVPFIINTRWTRLDTAAETVIKHTRVAVVSTDSMDAAKVYTGVVADDLQRLYVTQTTDTAIQEIDRFGRTLRISIALPGAPVSADGLCFDGRSLWFLSDTTDRIYNISLN